ncbi:MAG: hypothetical protein JWQ97_4015 [Phenylobacterium sp.]|nr:hypothetical protein [Phenylobacterium sp.]
MLRPVMLRNVTSVIATALALSATAAVAAPPPEQASVVVRTSDLDLRSDAGAGIALQRIRAAARAVCGEEPDLRQLGRQALIRACVRGAVDRTVASAHSPRLAALNGVPAGLTVAAAQ